MCVCVRMRVSCTHFLVFTLLVWIFALQEVIFIKIEEKKSDTLNSLFAVLYVIIAMNVLYQC